MGDLGSLSDLENYAAQLDTQFGLPTGFLEAQTNAESSWNPNAQNGNATGLDQFMPATADQFQIDPTNPYESLTGAAEYDSQLYGQSGSWEQVLQSYGTTAGSALQTSQSARDANSLAQNADAGSSFLPGMDSGLGVTPQSQGAPANYGGATTSTAPSTSGAFASFTSWLSSEKYNAFSIVIGVALVVLGVWKMLAESGMQMVQGLGEGI